MMLTMEQQLKLIEYVEGAEEEKQSLTADLTTALETIRSLTADLNKATEKLNILNKLLAQATENNLLLLAHIKNNGLEPPVVPDLPPLLN
jgi:ethanolamine utilization protein EutP (predicted NTPase)